METIWRIEVFTCTVRRWTWSAKDKARIVAERLTSGDSVCVVARRHGLSPQQLFVWRLQARQPLEATGGEDARNYLCRRLSMHRYWPARIAAECASGRVELTASPGQSK